MRSIVAAVTLLALVPVASALEGTYEVPDNLPEMEQIHSGGFVTALIVEDDGSLLLAELDGDVKTYDAATGKLTRLFKAPAVTGPEWGLTGLARDDEGTIYTMYTTGPEGVDPETNDVLGELRVSRWVGDEETIIFVTDATRSHNGGRLLWHEGALFVTVGEHTRGVESSEKRMKAQDPADVAGTILRMLPDGGPAAGNPAETDPRFDPLVYSYGHRNPFGIDWDAGRDTLVISDPAYEHNEEINHVAPGGNLGWPVCVGPCDPPNPTMVDPIVVYPEVITPVGLVVVGPDYYVGAYNLAQVRRVYETEAGWTDEVVAESPAGILDVAASPDGEWIYIGTWNGTWRFPASDILDETASSPGSGDAGRAAEANDSDGVVPAQGILVTGAALCAVAMIARRRLR